MPGINRRKQNPILIFLFVALPVIAVVSCMVSGVDARDETGKYAGKDTGSIHGTVVCQAGNEPKGDISLYSGYEYVDYTTIGPDGDFTFTGLEAGSYTLSYWEYGLIPGDVEIPVEVTAGQTTEIALQGRVCLSCTEILDMPFDEYNQLMNESYGGYIYSEAGMDSVAQIYGICYRERNDGLIEGLDESSRTVIPRLRDMIYYFEEPFLVLEWTGGTGSGHMLNRAIVEREMLIQEIIEETGAPENNRDAALEEWNTTVDRLYLVAEYFESMVESEYMGEVMTGVPEQLRVATGGLDGVVQGLPAQIIELVNDYMQVYLYPLEQDE